MAIQVPPGMTFWELCATWSWGTYTTDIDRQFILTALSLAGAPGTALDVGCEGGRWSQMLSRSGWQMICTDVNEDTLRICQKRLPEARCIVVKPTDTTLPCISDSLKLLLCIEVFQLGNRDWIFEEARRTLKVGGLWIMTCGNRASWRGMWAVVRGTADTWYPGTYSEFKRKLDKHGFSVIRERGYAWFPFPRLSNSSLVPVCTRIEQFLGLRFLTTLSPWIAVIGRKRGLHTQ